MEKTMFPKISLCLIILTSVLLADVWQVRPPGRSADQPNWNAHFDSDHFSVWYAPEAPIDQASAQTALNEMEKILDFYVVQKGFATSLLSASPKYKVNCCVITSGWAYGGMDGAYPSMWLAAGAVKDNWALAHEFCHSLQGVSGGFTDSKYVGWFWECHANWMAHQMYPDNAHCSEMYTRMAEVYCGSTRCRYCNWQLLEYLKEKNGFSFVNGLWTKSARQSDPAHMTEDVLATIMRTGNMSVDEFGNMFEDFAMKNVTWDYSNGAVYRQSYDSQPEIFKRPRLTGLEILDSSKNRYIVPFDFAPQRYGYNIVRLYPTHKIDTLTVAFRGCVQDKNNISSYSSKNEFEPVNINDPGSDWRIGIVVVNNGVPRYTPVIHPSYGAGEVKTVIQSNENEAYLVVTAAPSIYSKILWDQMYYTIYRYPWMVEIKGAMPEGYQNVVNPAGKFHPNGGGFVASTATVDLSAYVSPKAKVLGNALVKDNARIDGCAVVKGGTVSGNAVVKDHALVSGGIVSGSAVIAGSAAVWNGQVYENALIDGFANIDLSATKVHGKAHVGGVSWVLDPCDISGTAQILGDGEIRAITATKGVFYGFVDQLTVTNDALGASRTSPVAEVTKPGPFTWWDPSIVLLNFYNTSNRSINPSVGEMRNDDVIICNIDKPSSYVLEIFDIRGRLIRSQKIAAGKTLIAVPELKTQQMLIWKLVSDKSIQQGVLTRIK